MIITARMCRAGVTETLDVQGAQSAVHGAASRGRH